MKKKLTRNRKTAQPAGLATADAQEVLETMSTALAIIDATGKISYLNRAATKLLDTAAKGRELPNELKPLGESIHVSRLLGLAFKRFEWQAGKGRTFAGNISPLPSAGSKAHRLMILFQDITASQKLERSMIEMDKLSALGQASSRLLHDIRNPINAIRNHAKTLLRRTKSASQLKAASEIIHQIDRLNDTLVEFSSDRLDRKESWAGLNLNDLLLSFKPYLPRFVSWKLSPSLPPVSCDRWALFRILDHFFHDAQFELYDSNNAVVETSVSSRNEDTFVRFAFRVKRTPKSSQTRLGAQKLFINRYLERCGISCEEERGPKSYRASFILPIRN